MYSNLLVRKCERPLFQKPENRLVAETTGGVSPLGWLQPATVLIDEASNDYEVVWAAAGHPYAVFPTNFAELVRVTGAKPRVVGE